MKPFDIKVYVLTFNCLVLPKSARENFTSTQKSFVLKMVTRFQSWRNLGLRLRYLCMRDQLMSLITIGGIIQNVGENAHRIDEAKPSAPFIAFATIKLLDVQNSAPWRVRFRCYYDRIGRPKVQTCSCCGDSFFHSAIEPLLPRCHRNRWLLDQTGRGSRRRRVLALGYPERILMNGLHSWWSWSKNQYWNSEWNWS